MPEAYRPRPYAFTLSRAELEALVAVAETAERLVEDVLQVQRKDGNVCVLIMAAAMTAKNRLAALDAAGINQTTGESK
jgi:hypothetical protein